MQKWEYMEVYQELDTQQMTRPWPDDPTDTRDLLGRLADWGQEGWEFVTSLEDELGVRTIYLKRPVE